MSTIDQLMFGKLPGEIEVTTSAWKATGDGFFRPFYKDSDGKWHGLLSDGSSALASSTSYFSSDGWSRWQPRKPKVVRYLWARKLSGKISENLLSDEEAPGYLNAHRDGEEAFDLSGWQRLDWSETEFME